jgi:hypothetical protein
MKKKSKGIVTLYERKTKRIDGSTRIVPAFKVASKELEEMGHTGGDQFKMTIERDRIIFNKVI